MDLSYSKSEKLKSRKAIDELFASGKHVSIFPLRLVYVKSSVAHEGIHFGVSVSKRHHKKAVDRNYIKRIMREAYRHQKHLLSGVSGYDMMLLYQSREVLHYQELEARTAEIFEKFLKKSAPAPPGA